MEGWITVAGAPKSFDCNFMIGLMLLICFRIKIGVLSFLQALTNQFTTLLYSVNSYKKIRSTLFLERCSVNAVYEAERR